MNAAAPITLPLATKRMRDIYRAVALAPHPPSVRELMVVAGLRTTNWTYVYVHALTRAGLLRQEPGKKSRRTLHVTPCDGHRWEPTTVNGRDAIIARLEP